MAIELTAKEFHEVWVASEEHNPPVTSSDRLETIRTVPAFLGHGYVREMELLPGLELEVFDISYASEFTYLQSENAHPVQFCVLSSGVIDSGEHLYQDKNSSYIGGSGVQPSHRSIHHSERPVSGVDIHLDPELFLHYFAASSARPPREIRSLLQGNDRQQTFSPRVTQEMRHVVQHIVGCPFTGIIKKTYLQGKVFELIALQLKAAFHDPSTTETKSLRPAIISRIHHAAEILRADSESPPSQADLAQQVGVGHCTLSKGFQEVFGMTPFAYLTRYRMQQAESLLQQTEWSVADIALSIGYANPAKFAAAFKKYWGRSPRECRRNGKA